MTDIPSNLASGFAPKNTTVVMVKDSRTQIWAYESEFKGRNRFHLREVYLDIDENWAPGKGGISVPVEHAPKFCAALAALTTPQAVKSVA